MTRAFAVVALAFSIACSSTSAPPTKSAPPTGDRVTEEENGGCPSSSTILYGTVPAGGACTEGADCAPSCCPCNNGTNRAWLAVHCKSNVCVGAPDVCTDTSDPSLCTTQ